MHSLLKRQIQKFALNDETTNTIKGFLEAVNQAYNQADSERKMLERSLELTSDDLIIRNQKLKDDIEKRIKVESELAESLSLQQATFNATADGILVVDTDGNIIQFNNRFIEMWQIPKNIIDSKDDNIAISFVLDQLLDPDSFVQKVNELYAHPEAKSHDTLQFKDGRVFERFSHPQILNGNIAGRVWSFSDQSEKYRMTKELKHKALHDSLTGLPNRSLLLNRLEQIIYKQQRDPKARFALYFIDLDRFKVINDSLGHFTGDKVLIMVAKLLNQFFRASDTVSRIGGDEFVILIDNIKNNGQILKIAKKIQKILSQTFSIDGRDLILGASIGVTSSTIKYENAIDILRDADSAMYHAKQVSKGSFAIFDETMHKKLVQTMQVESHIRKAIEQDELELAFQPIVDCQNYEIVSCEALLRINGLSVFNATIIDVIHIAEETGLINDIGDWVLRKACQFVKKLENLNNHSNVAINVSPRQFKQNLFVNKVRTIFEEENTNPERITFELTESLFLGSEDNINNTLLELKELGISIAIDDFGVGYSSLSYLHRFPIDRLKIDRSFISNMEESPESVAITKTILQLGQNMSLHCVAEGVETWEQFSFLQKHGCQLIQGYLFSKPINEVQFLEYLKDYDPTTSRTKYLDHS